MAKTVDEVLTVYYPSGNEIKVFARFSGHGAMNKKKDSPYGVFAELLESTFVNKQIMGAGSILGLDPRCVVKGEKSGLLYNGRDHHKKFEKDMRKWMVDHPEWPPKELLAS